MATGASPAAECVVSIRVFDGARQSYADRPRPLIRVLDLHGRSQVAREIDGANLNVTVPFFNNFADSYSVLASADGYKDAGFFPVKVTPLSPQRVDLMLVKKDTSPNFHDALWDQLPSRRPRFTRVLGAGAGGDAAARDRYTELIENKSLVAACLLNILTAVDQIHLTTGTPLDYFQQLDWDSTMAQDRFFAWADAKIIDEVRAAVEAGVFEPAPAALHPGATSSYKQIQFGEANVQLTFHENTVETIGGVRCVRVEPDIDYFRDRGAHALFEVITNALGSMTDPRQVYVLRWIAGRRAGVPEFDPLYTLA